MREKKTALSHSLEIADDKAQYDENIKNICGNYSGKSRYDLMEIIMVCLGKSKNKEYNKLIEMLNVLLASNIGAKEKEDILYYEYGIKSTIKLEKELRQMCNLSDLVEEQAIKRGMKKGMQQGKARMLVDMVDNFVIKNSVPFETALDMLSVTQNQYEEAKALLA